MSNYVKSTNFYAKDALATGNPDKVIKGSELNTEFDNIATAIASKTELNSPTFTGVPSAPTASVGTNSTQIATTAFVLANGVGVPSGGIIMWSGSVLSIPTGFNLCDGSNGSPDLRNKFIVGAGSTYAVGATGGTTSTDLTGVSTSSVGDHYHAMGSGSGTSTGTQATSIGAAVVASSSSSTSITVTPGNCYVGATYAADTTTTTSTTGPSLTGNAGGHSHTLSGTLTTIPPYYALCYIMKL